MTANIWGIVKAIQDIMRKDPWVDGDAQRIGQISWLLFLKIYDDKEREFELMIDGYVSPIPEEYKWRNWAGNDEGITGDVSNAKRTNWIITTINWYYNEFWLNQSELHKEGTLCVTIAANIAECGFLWFDSCLPDSIVCFDLISEELKRYTYFFIQNSKQYLEEFAPQTAQKNINLEILQNLPFPLPPTKELNKIVWKVDELMQSCEQLDEQVQQAKERSEKLMESVLQGVFNW